MKRTLLISVCFAFTFLLGGAAGWLLKPASPAPAVTTTTNVTGTNAPANPLGERLFTELNDSLAFTPAQQTVIRPLCDEWGTQAAANGHRPRLKLALFERYVPRIRAQLATNQFANYDDYVADARARAQKRAR
jgi:uncharacterized membrane protein